MQDVRRELRSEQQDIKRYLENRQVRNYYIAVIAASLAAWTLTFNYGAYNTVFFRTLFSVWVLCTVIFFATLMLPKHERPLTGGRLAILLLPTLWVLAFVFVPVEESESARIFEWITNGLALATIITLPSLGYSLLVIMQGETLRLPWRLLFAMSVIVLAVAIAGYVMGNFHYLFITCQEFIVAGDFAPPNCLQLP